MDTSMSSGNPTPAPVQHVTKASSDELLRKFAQVGSEADLKKDLHLAIKRRRKISSSNTAAADLPSGRRDSWPEGRSLLPVGKIRTERRLGRSRVRDFKNRSIFGTIQKTWRRTVEGASKVFVEKHFYNRHKRLINDPALY